MLTSGNLPQQILVQGLIARQFGVSGLDALSDNRFKILVLD
jgi:hypothetical protein